MKKAFLAIFILFDIGLIGGSGFFLMNYIQGHRLKPSAVSLRVAAPASVTPISTSAVKAAGAALSVPVPGNGAAIRNIGFTYRNPHVKSVSIRADFTGWKAELMKKGENGNWTYQAPLSPGEYAYCFTADDKTFKDPANKRTKQIGRTMVSAIVVEALPAKTPK